MSLAITAGSQVVVGATMTEGNGHDSKTLEATLRQYQRLNDRLPKKTITDRGYRGLTEVLGVQMWYPDRFKAGTDVKRSAGCGTGSGSERPLNP